MNLNLWRRNLERKGRGKSKLKGNLKSLRINWRNWNLLQKCLFLVRPTIAQIFHIQCLKNFPQYSDHIFVKIVNLFISSPGPTLTYPSLAGSRFRRRTFSGTRLSKLSMSNTTEKFYKEATTTGGKLRQIYEENVLEKLFETWFYGFLA